MTAASSGGPALRVPVSAARNGFKVAARIGLQLSGTTLERGSRSAVDRGLAEPARGSTARRPSTASGIGATVCRVVTPRVRSGRRAPRAPRDDRQQANADARGEKFIVVNEPIDVGRARRAARCERYEGATSWGAAMHGGLIGSQKRSAVGDGRPVAQGSASDEAAVAASRVVPVFRTRSRAVVDVLRRAPSEGARSRSAGTSSAFAGGPMPRGGTCVSPFVFFFFTKSRRFRSHRGCELVKSGLPSGRRKRRPRVRRGKGATSGSPLPDRLRGFAMGGTPRCF